MDRRSENLVGPDGVHVRVYGSGLSFSGLPDDEARANAHLIAASPELLEALKDITYYYSRHVGDNVYSVIKANAAIAKAEGASAEALSHSFSHTSEEKQ